jgi:hypothetical protein
MDDNNLITEDLLLRYLRGQMTDEEKTDFQVRLIQNSALRKQLEMLRVTQQALKAGQVQSPAPTPANKWRWTIAAGSLLLMVSIAGWLSLQKSPSNATPPLPPVNPVKSDQSIPAPSEPVAQTTPGKQPHRQPVKPAEPKADDRKIIAADYTPNAYLEQYINSNVRSSDFTIQLSSPGLRIRAGQPVTFEGMASEACPDALELSIFSNKSIDFEQDKPMERSAFFLHQTVKNKTFTTTLKGALPPGLYYYIIGVSDKDIAVGKFSIY